MRRGARSCVSLSARGCVQREAADCATGASSEHSGNVARERRNGKSGTPSPAQVVRRKPGQRAVTLDDHTTATVEDEAHAEPHERTRCADTPTPRTLLGRGISRYRSPVSTVQSPSLVPSFVTHVLTLTQRRQDGVGIMAVAGRVDPTTVAEFEAGLQALLPDVGYRLVLDLTNVAFVSSLGLRVLMTTLVSVRAKQGALVICGLNDDLTTLFRMSGFLGLFDVTATEADALATLAG